jgi:hypothetical protein
MAAVGLPTALPVDRDLCARNRRLPSPFDRRDLTRPTARPTAHQPSTQATLDTDRRSGFSQTEQVQQDVRTYQEEVRGPDDAWSVGGMPP